MCVSCVVTPFAVCVEEGVLCCGFVWSLCGALRGVVEVPPRVCSVDDLCGGMVSGGVEWVVVARGFE